MNNSFDGKLNVGEEVVIEIKHNKSVLISNIVFLLVGAAIFFVIDLLLNNIFNYIDSENLNAQFDLKTANTVKIWVLTIAFLVLGVYPPIVDSFRILKSKLILTNYRLIGKNGIFCVQHLDLPLEKIKRILVSSSILGKIFRFASVEIEVEDEYRYIIFIGVSNANEFKNKFIGLIAKSE